MEDWAAYLTGGAALIPARDMVRIPARLAQTFLTLQTLRLSQAPWSRPWFFENLAEARTVNSTQWRSEKPPPGLISVTALDFAHA
jgi:hypothetical protein